VRIPQCTVDRARQATSLGRGRRCVPVEVDQPMIDDLVRQRFLKPGARKDNAAIGAALALKLRVTRQYSGTP
jgi:hypothetical protein